MQTNFQLGKRYCLPEENDNENLPAQAGVYSITRSKAHLAWDNYFSDRGLPGGSATWTELPTGTAHAVRLAAFHRKRCVRARARARQDKKFEQQLVA